GLSPNFFSDADEITTAADKGPGRHSSSCHGLLPDTQYSQVSRRPGSEPGSYCATASVEQPGQALRGRPISAYGRSWLPSSCRHHHKSGPPPQTGQGNAQSIPRY